jgi:predicted RNase H-like HicB family nuclease
MKNKAQVNIEPYMSLPWHYCTEASEWEGEKGYWVSVAELPDCSTFAVRLEDGLAAIPNLLREYLKVAISNEAVIPIPENATEPTLVDKILLRVPMSLHMGVKTAAKQERTSINQFAVKALTEAVTRTVKPRAGIPLLPVAKKKTKSSAGV